MMISQPEKKKSVVEVERKDWTDYSEFTTSFGLNYLRSYSLHTVKVSGESVSAKVKAAKEFLVTLGS